VSELLTGQMHFLMLTNELTNFNISMTNKHNCHWTYWYSTLYSFLLWLHLDILREATAWYSVVPAKIFLDMKTSRCSTRQMCARDVGIEPGFGPCMNTHKKNKNVDNPHLKAKMCSLGLFPWH